METANPHSFTTGIKLPVSTFATIHLVSAAYIHITFACHINLLCRDCYYQLRQLRVVSRSLSQGAAATLVHAFVVSRLDYCSALYAGLPAVRVGCLDRVLRVAAHLIGRIPTFGQVSEFVGCPALASIPTTDYV